MYAHVWIPSGYPFPAPVMGVPKRIAPMLMTIEQDVYEKDPIDFPDTVMLDDGTMSNVTVVRKKLGVGDYRWRDLPGAVGIERKGKPTELFSAFIGSDRKRVEKQLDALISTYKFPYLFIDSAPGAVLSFDYARLIRGATKSAGVAIVRSIAYQAGKRNLPVVWCGRTLVDPDIESPDSKFVGELALGVLLAGKKLYRNFLDKSDGIVYPSVREALNEMTRTGE